MPRKFWTSIGVWPAFAVAADGSSFELQVLKNSPGPVFWVLGFRGEGAIIRTGFQEILSYSGSKNPKE